MKLIKFFILLLPLCAGITNANAQGKFFTRNGQASFFSEAPLENIEAHNKQVLSIINTKTGEIVVNMLMKSFEFEKALMQEHFNENYVESDKFPKASFKGKIINLSDVDFEKNGTYNAEIKGSMTIHGITRSINTKGSIEVKDKEIKAQSAFVITIKDYDIQIPKVVSQNIAENVDIKIDLNYAPYKK